jgi:CheY-like chemotaxis protein
MNYYLRAFRLKDFDVRQYFDPDSAIEYITQKKPHIEAIILDIMMLPGKKYSNEDTDNGLRTGVLLYKDLRTHYPNIPIVFLTNVSNPEIPTLPNETVDTLEVVQKIDYPPFELVELVEKMIDGTKKLERA